jgi:hypothetical protein
MICRQVLWENCWLGATTVIAPAQVQAQVDALVSAFIPPILVDSDPGAHGDTIFGMHGCGVSTPFAAEVAAAT